MPELEYKLCIMLSFFLLQILDLDIKIFVMYNQGVVHVELTPT